VPPAAKPRYGRFVASIESVNVGTPQPYVGKGGLSGIDKIPTAGAVRVDVPGFGRSGLAGDAVLDTPHHGGPDQAVYAYAREDLAVWAAELGRELRGGFFGENLTTLGLDLTGAVVGETWRVGEQVELQVTYPRTPCATFTDQMKRPRWAKEFTARGVPGTYLRVLRAGDLRSGDPVTVLHRPDHGVTVGFVFRALHREPELLPELAAVPDLPAKVRDRVARRVPAG
jgi:MOSC domain-containing protein YiiM